ncbi:hypothetical protein [Paraglaciecola arctica]|uniref:hypothetical protein n=1 Tax=Paraglaciecola arctica TaxID=1128911 RepID=UPI001C07366C|nr:hypothetical protein [Paraglaciecola arctica]MBU3002311.1 hypothetical protein [Paraglaciecola arctica]
MSRAKCKLTALIFGCLFSLDYAAAHSGPLNKLALQACVDKVKSQSCRYEGGHNNLYIGTCQHMPEKLSCVRNQPIQKLSDNQSDIENKHQHEHTNRKPNQ